MKILDTLAFREYLSFVTQLAQKIKGADLAGRVITQEQLGRLIGGSDASRWNRVSRAQDIGVLERLRRELYVLSEDYGGQRPHRFVVAQALRPLSYVTAETALSHAQWIPEAVYSTLCALPGRKRYELEHATYGRFEFRSLAHNPWAYLSGVNRETLQGGVAFVASPLRALLDLVAWRKQEWSGLDWIVDGLRIDEERLRSVQQPDLDSLRGVYKHSRMERFISALDASLFGSVS